MELKVDRSAAPPIHLPCPVCGEQGLQAHLLSLRTLGGDGKEDSPWLSFHRCGACDSLLSKEQGPAPKRSAERQALVDSINRRGFIEFFSGYDRQTFPLRSFTGMSPGRFLDIGCGLGIGPDFAESLPDWTGVGVDPAPDSAHAAEALGFPFKNEVFDPGWPSVGGPFGLIQSLELLEHVPAPLAFLKAARRLLSNDGLLYLTTPDAGAVRPDASDRDILRILAPPEHLHLISRKALQAMLCEAGFDWISIESNGRELLVMAGSRPPAERPEAEAWDLFRNYLVGRAAELEDGNPFKSGFQARGLQLAVGIGDWDLARSILPWFEDDLARRWAIDLSDPGLTWTAPFKGAPDPQVIDGLPLNLTIVLFTKARLAQTEQRWADARHWFALAELTGRFTAESLNLIGLYDGETAFLAEKAERFPKSFPE